MSKSIPAALSIAALLATGLAAPTPVLAQGKPLGGLFSCDAGGGKQEGG